MALRALSDGYSSFLALVGHVVRHGIEFGSASGPLRLPVGMILIDEIDLHLHPSWQRRVLSDLTRSFPQAQFIVTSHSPMVTGSTPPDGIVLLRREGDRIAIRSDMGSVQGWRADQILTSALFDLESSRDIETTNLIERYTQLSIAEFLSENEESELDEIAAELRLRLPTSAEKEHAREAFKYIEATYREKFDALPMGDKERLVAELKAQLLEAMTQSRRPQ